MIKKFLFTSALFFVFFSLVTVGFVWAEFPDRKIRVIVPMAAGGGIDMAARTLVRYANLYLGDKVYVDNVVGAGGAIGIREAAKASPDGYTLLVTSNMILTGPLVAKDYPTVDLFDPVCIVERDATSLAVMVDSRFKTPADLISYAKANPGQVSAGHAGIGSSPHFALEAFAEATGAKFNLVPFKGSNPALMAAVGGHVDVATATCSEYLSLYEGKKLRSLIVFGEKRARIYPDAPTAKEVGYDIIIATFYGPYITRGVPKEVMGILGEAFKKAAENVEFKKAVEQRGREATYLPMKEAVPYIKAQRDLLEKLAAKVGIEQK